MAKLGIMQTTLHNSPGNILSNAKHLDEIPMVSPQRGKNASGLGYS